MGLADLLAALEADAQREIAHLDAETRRQAEEILASAEADARELEERPIREQEPLLAIEIERMLEQARVEAARSLRAVREGEFRSLLDEARGRLAGLRDRDDYRRVLAVLIVEARAALPSGNLLHVDPHDEAVAAAVLAELGWTEIELSPSLDTWGGVGLASADGRVARNTLEERFANAEPSLRLRLVDDARELTPSTER